MTVGMGGSVSPGGRKEQAFPVAEEELGADGGLELLHACGDVRGHAVQLASGLYDAAFLDDGLEDLERGEIHGVICSLLENDTFLIIQFRGLCRDLSIRAWMLELIASRPFLLR